MEDISGSPTPAAQPGAMREQRKFVTVLAGDVVGSTALGERLDPEDVRLVVGGAIERMIAAVEDLGGTVKDLAGDGLFALFGAPVTHEDDPERAVRTALRIIREIVEYAGEVEQGWGIPGFSVRIGIAWRFGFDVDSRPVAATPWLKWVCSLPSSPSSVGSGPR